MNQAKPLLQSKTIKGAISEIIAVIVLVVGFFGFDVDGDSQAQVINHTDDIFVAVLAIWKAINNIVIIYGRITATQPLSIGGKLNVPKSRLPGFLPFIICLSVLTGCAASENQDKISIKGFSLLVITDLATDNVQPTDGSTVDISTVIEGIPLEGAFQSGGIMAKSDVEIEAATGGTVIIERALSGNLNASLSEIAERIFKPVDHPFGNITVDGSSAMREHVE